MVQLQRFMFGAAAAAAGDRRRGKNKNGRGSRSQSYTDRHGTVYMDAYLPLHRSIPVEKKKKTVNDQKSASLPLPSKKKEGDSNNTISPQRILLHFTIIEW